MNKATIPSLLIVVLLLGACATSPPDPYPADGIAFPRQPPADGERETMAAEMYGDFVNRDGCLHVVNEEFNADYLLIWPPDVSYRVEDDTVQIIDKDGTMLVQTGEPIYIDGGEIPASNTAAFEEQTDYLPVMECAGPYWIIGETIRRHDP